METDKVSIYSPKYKGESFTEFEKFLAANNSHTNPQLKKYFDAIVSAIEKIGETGAYERYFRPEGGRVKAIPIYITLPRVNKNIGKMRLYCLRYSDKLLIMGNGAVTTAQKNEDDPVLIRIIDNLRKIDWRINVILKQSKIDSEDFNALKTIIENITI